MADSRMPDEFYEVVAHHLPPDEPVGPKGGRPTVPNYTVMRVLWYVLTTGCRWRDVPPEMGCCGETARLRLAPWEEIDVWERVKVDMLRLLRQAGKLDQHTAIIDGALVRAHGGGEKTGPSPVDRRKKGSKYTLMVDKKGIPLAIRIAPANASEHTQIIPILVEQFPEVGGKPGRPPAKPTDVYADAGYDSEATRSILAWLGMIPHIPKRGRVHGSGLGKVRWVVERAISWVKGLRRLRTRYDRKAEVIEAWGALAISVINFRIWNKDITLT